MKLLKKVLLLISIHACYCIGMEQNISDDRTAHMSKDDTRVLRALAISMQACSQVRSNSSHFYPGAWHPEPQTLGELERSCHIIAKKFNNIIAKHTSAAEE